MPAKMAKSQRAVPAKMELNGYYNIPGLLGCSCRAWLFAQA